MDQKTLMAELGLSTTEEAVVTPPPVKNEEIINQYREQIERQEKELAELEALIAENDKIINDEIEAKVAEYRQALGSEIAAKKETMLDRIRIPLESARAELVKLGEKE
jgi:vacuolar-type H+-ATPase subunit I/STV1